MKKLSVIALLLASCQTAPQTPNQACESYCSTNGSALLQEDPSGCFCKTDVSIRAIVGNCLTSASDQNKNIQCFKTAQAQCHVEGVKMEDANSVCAFIKALEEAGQL